MPDTHLVTRKSADGFALALLSVSTLIFCKLEVQYLLCWLIGALLYLKPHRLGVLLSCVFCSVLSGLSISWLQLTGDGFMKRAGTSPTLNALCEILLAIGIGFLCVTLASLRSTWVSRFGVRLAALSYTLYLTHYPITMLWHSRRPTFDQVDFHSMVWFGLVVTGCLLFAWMMYYPFERNTARVRRTAKHLLGYPTVPVKIMHVSETLSETLVTKS